MSAKNPNEATLFEHLAAESRFDLAGTLATLHPDVLFEDLPIGLVLWGREHAAKHYRLWWDAFQIKSDGGSLHWVNNDLVIGESHFTGTHKGEFLGVAPAGRDIRFPFTVVVTFKEGLLSGERFYYDLNGVLRQLGHPHFRTAA